MSSVLPSSDVNSLYNYYSKAIKEMDEQARNSAKQNRENREKELSRIEENHKAALREYESDTADTINNIKSNASKALTQEREKHQEDLLQVKDKHHQEMSAVVGPEGPIVAYKKAMNEIQDQAKEEVKRNKESHEKEISDLDNRYRATDLDREHRTREAVNSVRSKMEESHAQQKESYYNELEQLKNNLYNKKGQVAISIPYETHKKDIQKALDEGQLRHENDVKHADALAEAQQERNRELIRKTGRQIEQYRDQQKEELGALQAENKAIRKQSLVEERQKNQEIANMHRQSEEDMRRDHRQLADAYQGNLDKLQKNLDGKEAYYQKLNTQAMGEKEAHSAEVIKRLTEEKYKDIKDLENTYKAQYSQVEKLRADDQKKASERLEHVVDTANERTNVLLEKQAKEYQETMNRSRKASQSEVELLEKELGRQRTSPDTSLVSPAAEAQIRNSIIHEYQKALDQEAEKNKLGIEHLNQKHIDLHKKTLEDFGDKETRIQHENTLNQNLERTNFLNTVQEMEYQTNTKIHISDQDHDREKENIYRQFGIMLDHQRREYENILETARADAGAKLTAARQDGANQAKIVHRTFTTRQNEIIREYEKKLADQKAEYEFKIDEIKAQARVDIRNLERKSKQDLEVQAQGYEHRIAQLEVQNKERERYMTQNFQDQIDRTKRSYELLSKKKS